MIDPIVLAIQLALVGKLLEGLGGALGGGGGLLLLLVGGARVVVGLEDRHPLTRRADLLARALHPRVVVVGRGRPGHDDDGFGEPVAQVAGADFGGAGGGAGDRAREDLRDRGEAGLRRGGEEDDCVVVSGW